MELSYRLNKYLNILYLMVITLQNNSTPIIMNGVAIWDQKQNKQETGKHVVFYSNTIAFDYVAESPDEIETLEIIDGPRWQGNPENIVASAAITSLGITSPGGVAVNSIKPEIVGEVGDPFKRIKLVMEIAAWHQSHLMRISYNVTAVGNVVKVP